MDKKMEIFVKNLKFLRTINHDSQEYLGDMIGVSKSAIGNYECGRNLPERENLIKIAENYKIPIDVLLNKDLSMDQKFLEKMNDSGIRYCPECGEFCMVKDKDGLYYCPSCHFERKQG